MRVYAEKVLVGTDGSFKLLLRAEDVPSRLMGKVVSLARRGNGYCLFPLENLAAHDDHAPVWRADGSAPMNSSAPDMTATKYLDRIRADIEALVRSETAQEVIPVWEDEVLVS